MPQKISNLNINNAHADLQHITSELENQSQVMKAMKHVLKENKKEIKCQCRCHLLQTLKSMKIGTNDVEYEVKRLSKQSTDAFAMIVKIKLLRHKISNVHEQLRKCQVQFLGFG